MYISAWGPYNSSGSGILEGPTNFLLTCKTFYGLLLITFLSCCRSESVVAGPWPSLPSSQEQSFLFVACNAANGSQCYVGQMSRPLIMTLNRKVVPTIVDKQTDHQFLNTFCKQTTRSLKCIKTEGERCGNLKLKCYRCYTI